MPISILMPALSPTMTEGKLTRWLKKEGDKVKSGQVIAEIETDKATMEVEAVEEGTLAKIMIPGNTAGVKVNALIAILLEEGEKASDLDAYITKHGGAAAASAPSAAIQAPAATPAPKAAPIAPQAASSGRVIASPLAKRIASQNNVDLFRVSGTGPKGRIIKVDVEGALSSGGSSRARLRNLAYTADGMPPYKAEPISGMRQVIADRLTLSKQTIPHFYLTIEVELDALLSLREQINLAQSQVKVSVNDLLVKAFAMALNATPKANAAWIGNELRYYESADVSVAVAIEGGLVTPVVRQAGEKPLLAISSEIKQLAEAARNGKLKPENWTGGTATLSNLGMFGIKQFEAIINPPQACILAVSASSRKQVVRPGDQLVFATMMNLTLSCDHRVVDGVLGAQLLSALRDIIEKKPAAMLL
jgi:pyruvate dehydrogenase E2 component (dihydrolipoamide acetyltransferase)